MEETHIPGNPDFAEPLVEMEKLLRSLQACGHANELEAIIKLLETDPQDAMKIPVGNFPWGGSGSFFDLFFVKKTITSQMTSIATIADIVACCSEYLGT